MPLHFFLAENNIASFWLGLNGDNVTNIELFETDARLSQKKLISRFDSAQFHTSLPTEIKALVDRIWLFDDAIPVEVKATPWIMEVWQATRRIPVGSTISYEELAVWAGRPKACRAAANALNVNPIPILVPCHRIIRKNKELGGFGAGIAIKKRLLAYEQQLKLIKL